jgi:hypothetical protein
MELGMNICDLPDRTADGSVVGLSFVVDIFQRLSDYNRWNQPIDLNEPVVPDDLGGFVRPKT